MNFIVELMLGKITKEDFLEINNITQIELVVKEGINEAYKKQDADNLEIFIYLIFAYCLYYKIYAGILNKLLLLDWHFQHENIVILLQKISDIESMSYLYEVIVHPPQYLLDDESYSFEIKCIRAIYHIGKERSKEYLENLCKNNNDIIKNVARRQIDKIDNNKA